MNATELRPTVDGGMDLGDNVEHIGTVFSDTYQVQDDQATFNPSSGATQIRGDQGGMNLGVAALSDAFDLFFAGSTNLRFEEDRIQFSKTGRLHRIDANGPDITILSELETDSVNLTTGTGRTNETVNVTDLFTFFKNETTDTTPYEIVVRYNNGTTIGQPAIGNLGFEAEDSGNTFRSYAGIVTAIDDDTSTNRDGRMQLVVADGNSTAQSTTGALTGIGLDIRGGSGTLKMGFFGATPVAQPNPAVSAAAIHAALVSLGIFQ